MQGPVRAAVAAAVEAMADDRPRARRDRRHPGQAGEGRLRACAPGFVPGDEERGLGTGRALDRCPDGPSEFRGVLVREHEWRVREGLVTKPRIDLPRRVRRRFRGD